MKLSLKKNLFAILAVFTLLLTESCQEQETIKPMPADQHEPSVVRRITDLGFDAAEIKDMGTHYLVDGDVYFSKSITDEEKPGSEPAGFDGKYPEFTVRMDTEIAGNDTWKAAVEYGIAAWNTDKRQHMRLVLTTSTEAHITVRTDHGELAQEILLASEFAEHGRLGATIRVNMKYTGSITAAETNQKMLRALYRTTGCHQPKISASGTPSRTASHKSSASAASEINPGDYLYIIRDDQLVRTYKTHVTRSTIEVLSEGWQGATHMEMGRDNYLYVIQYGVLWWASPYDGTWGALSDGWSGAQALAKYYTYDYLLIIDKNRDLYLASNTNSGKLKFYDLGSSGTFRMEAVRDGIVICDFDKNTLLFYSFDTGKLTTVVKSTDKVSGESDPIKWKNAVDMIRVFRFSAQGDVLWIPMKGKPERLLHYYVGGTSIYNIDNVIDWDGVKTVAYSIDSHYWQYLHFLHDGRLYKWELNFPGFSELQCRDCDWQGAFLIACTY